MTRGTLVAVVLWSTVSCREGEPPTSDAGDVDVIEAGFSGDAGDLVPMMCPSINQHVPQVTALDPATGCPTAIELVHSYSEPHACDTVEACCHFPAACTFETTVTYYLRGPCGGFQPQPSWVAGCRCVGGLVSCPNNSTNAIVTSCLDCPIDGGR